LSNFELVKTRKITYDLPILIIYNPVSGKKTNLVPLIETRLKLEKIPYELLPTQKRHDTYFFAKEIDLSKYSLLVAAGGDGSYHEVVNGMLARPDNFKLPIAMLPNGSGNDTCASIGVKTLDDALNYIVNAEVIPLDTVKCLIDYDHENLIPEDKILTNYRHMLINATLAVPAKIANEA
jgi:diacylglycerol kinase family enzyme